MYKGRCAYGISRDDTIFEAEDQVMNLFITSFKCDIGGELVKVILYIWKCRDERDTWYNAIQASIFGYMIRLKSFDLLIKLIMSRI